MPVKVTGVESFKIKLKKLKRPVSRGDADFAGKLMVREMKRLIEFGISPVRGGGHKPKYRPYHGSYKARIKKRGIITVNGQKYAKSLRPVNLRLTGDFLKDLKHRVEKGAKGFEIAIGYRDNKQILKEEGHRKGTNNQRKRPTIPVPQKGEKFSPTVINKFREVVLRSIKKISKRR